MSIFLSFIYTFGFPCVYVYHIGCIIVFNWIARHSYIEVAWLVCLISIPIILNYSSFLSMFFIIMELDSYILVASHVPLVLLLSSQKCYLLYLMYLGEMLCDRCYFVFYKTTYFSCFLGQKLGKIYLFGSRLLLSIFVSFGLFVCVGLYTFYVLCLENNMSNVGCRKLEKSYFHIIKYHDKVKIWDWVRFS